MPKPIKRHEALKPLSRDHHHGLLLSWKIRTGLSKSIAVARIKRYLDWFFENHLKDHFAMEEKYIFPLLGNEHEMVQRVLKEHQRLALLFTSPDVDVPLLESLEKELVDHIRFEERVLFNEIQKTMSQDEIRVIEQVIVDTKPKEEWEDEFWLK